MVSEIRLQCQKLGENRTISLIRSVPINFTNQPDNYEEDLE